MRKKKILLMSDWTLCKSGFGRNTKTLLTYLYKTGKYDLVNYACGMNWSNPEFQKTPWKSVGCLPDTQQEIDQYLNSFPPHEREPRMREMSYGDYYLDRIIKEEKPDIFIGAQDIWGISFACNRSWFDKITSVLWTTLDSRPILKSAIDAAGKSKHFWTWAKFAATDMNKMGLNHVKAVPSGLETNVFRPLPPEKKLELRNKFNIEKEAFIVGFVFRNQLRKSVPNLIEGYSIWKKYNPNQKSYLLLHTHFQEGWDIMGHAAQFGVNPKEILTTYVCRNCKGYEVKSFCGPEVDCKYCNVQKGQITTGVGMGVSEENLNEVYNLMDAYIHPATSGGFEIPCFENFLAGNVSAITNYSFGEEMCNDGVCIPLNWHAYTEIGTGFIKASTDPTSIAEAIHKIFSLSPEQKEHFSKVARQWVIDNYSIQTVGKFFEDFIDQAPLADYSFLDQKPEPKSPQAQVAAIQDNKEWLKVMYKEILKMDIKDDDSGLLYWLDSMSKGTQRSQVESFFRQTAQNENQKLAAPLTLADLINKNDKKKVCVCMPESIGDVFLSSSLLKSIKRRYSDWELYFATKPENFDILKLNPYITKVIPYTPEMDNLLLMEGIGNHKGYFDVFYPIYSGTQRWLTSVHNGRDLLDIELK